MKCVVLIFQPLIAFAASLHVANAQTWKALSTTLPVPLAEQQVKAWSRTAPAFTCWDAGACWSLPTKARRSPFSPRCLAAGRIWTGSWTWRCPPSSSSTARGGSRAAVEVPHESVVYPGISFTRNRDVVGVSIDVTASVSADFTVPADVVETVEDLGGGVDRVTLRGTVPLPAITTFFFHVKVADD